MGVRADRRPHSPSYAPVEPPPVECPASGSLRLPSPPRGLRETRRRASKLRGFTPAPFGREHAAVCDLLASLD